MNNTVTTRTLNAGDQKLLELPEDLRNIGALLATRIEHVNGGYRYSDACWEVVEMYKSGGRDRIVKAYDNNGRRGNL